MHQADSRNERIGAGFLQKCVGGLHVPGPGVDVRAAAHANAVGSVGEALLGRAENDCSQSNLSFAQMLRTLEERFVAEVLLLHRRSIFLELGKNSQVTNPYLATGLQLGFDSLPFSDMNGPSDRKDSDLYFQCTDVTVSAALEEKNESTTLELPENPGKQSYDENMVASVSKFPVADANDYSHIRNVGPLPFAAKKDVMEPIAATKVEQKRSIGHLLSMNKRATLSHKASTDHIGLLVNKLHGREHAQTWLQEVVYSDTYTYILTSAVICQAALLGLQVELETQYQVKRINNDAPEDIPLVLDIANYALLSFFLVEVIFRVAILKAKFFFPNDSDIRVWNYFDLMIVICSLPDFVAIDASDIPILHAIRLLRVIRILRVARGIPPLRKMVFTLIHCMLSLLWLVALMIVLLYMFALAFMQGAAADMKKYEITVNEIGNTTARLLATKARSSDTDCTDTSLHPYEPLDGIATAMESLFFMVTGDAEWSKVLKPVMESDLFYKCLGLFFSVFFFFGFMNVATGLFVEKAMQIASQDREMVLREALQREEDDIAIIRELFDAADLDGDGQLTVDEMRELVSNDDVRMWLAIIDLDIADDFDAVLDILDPHNKGYVEAEEFYATIGRFRGSARKLETSLILLEARASQRSLHRHHTMHHSDLNNLASTLGMSIQQMNEKAVRNLQIAHKNSQDSNHTTNLDEVLQAQDQKLTEISWRLASLENDRSLMTSAHEETKTPDSLDDQILNIAKFIDGDGHRRKHLRKLR